MGSAMFRTVPTWVRLGLAFTRDPLEPPGGVHDLRMDGGLPPGFQKGTLF